MTQAEFAQQFVKHYYETFDNQHQRENLRMLYNERSQLIFEGELKCGPDAIMQKLLSLPFKVVQHIITTIDAQPCANDTLIIAVLGQLKTDDDPPHSFFQTFVLAQNGNAVVVINDIFRLVVHNG